jgi:uncharacterized glyoxalase superfamily protein PhnB
MLRAALPVLHVTSSKVAEDFYCGLLGFQKEFDYLLDRTQSDPCYMGVRRDNAWIHLSSFSGDGVAGGVVFVLVDDVDVLYREFVDKGIAIHLPPTDQTWGNREMYIKDPDGNSIRFVFDPVA